MKQSKADLSKNSSKLHLDKYYTPIDLAKYCIEKTYEIIGKENISEIIEPSAGNGSFSNQIENCIAYDIEPEGENITKQDYLDLELEYKKGRLIIGNPPYGVKNNLTVSFFKKSVGISDYIAFILPISQLNNNIKLYEFDLIHSEDLGNRFYTDRYIHCCLNIYKRPTNNMLNSKPNYKLQDVEIVEARKSKDTTRSKVVNYEDFKYDIRIMAWGGGVGRKNQLGCEVEYAGQFTKEFCIKVNNDTYKNEVISIIKNTHWEDIYPMTATPNLLQWQVLKYLKEKIPNLK